MAHPKALVFSGADPHLDYSRLAAAAFGVTSIVQSGARAAAIVAVGLGAVHFLGVADVNQASEMAIDALKIAAGFGVAGRLAGMITEKVRGDLYDSAEGQRLLSRIRPKAEEILAARRGALWVVDGVVFPNGPEVMTDREYQDFKRMNAGLEIDEISFTQAKAVLRRFKNGRIDSGSRDLPAVVTYDLEFGRPKTALWYDDGKKSDKATVTARNAGRAAAREQSMDDARRRHGYYEHLPVVGGKPVKDFWQRVNGERMAASSQARVLATVAEDCTGILATRHSEYGVWDVAFPGMPPRRMTGAETAELLKDNPGLSIDTVTFGEEHITVRRSIGLDADAGIRDLPAIEVYRAADGAKISEAWFDMGVASSQDEILDRNMARRLEPANLSSSL